MLQINCHFSGVNHYFWEIYCAKHNVPYNIQNKNIDYIKYFNIHMKINYWLAKEKFYFENFVKDPTLYCIEDHHNNKIIPLMKTDLRLYVEIKQVGYEKIRYLITYDIPHRCGSVDYYCHCFDKEEMVELLYKYIYHNPTLEIDEEFS